MLLRHCQWKTELLICETICQMLETNRSCSGLQQKILTGYWCQGLPVSCATFWPGNAEQTLNPYWYGKTRKIAPSCDSYLNAIHWILSYILCTAFYVLYSMHCILCIVFYALYCILCIVQLFWRNITNFETRWWPTDQQTDKPTNRWTDGHCPI